MEICITDSCYIPPSRLSYIPPLPHLRECPQLLQREGAVGMGRLVVRCIEKAFHLQRDIGKRLLSKYRRPQLEEKEMEEETWISLIVVAR